MWADSGSRSNARGVARAAQRRTFELTEQGQNRAHELTERGQNTDRFTAAVAQLGDTSPAIEVPPVARTVGVTAGG
jgi:hypothetical protein